MEIPNEEGDEMAIPLNTYGHGHAHMIHHHDHHHHEHPPPPPSHIIIPSSTADDFKKPSAARYRECLKNHAAAMGGNATDGCGEFMPSGEDGTLEALTCSACSCHRNFHRKEPDSAAAAAAAAAAINGRKLFHHQQHRYPELYHHHAAAALRAAPPQMIMAYGGGESDDGGRAGNVKKRFRTKFSQEQKEKMLSFAEKVGWKIQKQEEGVVQQFCQEVGVKRRVLKVWMHNNKHTLAKKTSINQSDAQIQSLGNDDN